MAIAAGSPEATAPTQAVDRLLPRLGRVAHQSHAEIGDALHLPFAIGAGEDGQARLVLRGDALVLDRAGDAGEVGGGQHVAGLEGADVAELVGRVGRRAAQIGGPVVAGAVGPHDLEGVAQHVAEFATSGERLVEAGELRLGQDCGVLLRLGGAVAAAEGPAGGEAEAEHGGEQQRAKAGQ